MDYKENKVFVTKITNTKTEHGERSKIKYPELLFPVDPDSKDVYDSIRILFYSAKLDIENYGSENWNPLSKIIKPGNKVLIKPNLVLHESHNKNEDYFSVVSHPDIIQCMTDYIVKALNGSGKITIGDAPINSADFNLICKNLGLYDIKSKYNKVGLEIDLVDFRLYKMRKDSHGVITSQEDVIKDDQYVEIIMDKDSALTDISDKYRRFRVTEYDGDTMPVYHNEEFHRYCFHKSALEADVILSIPKIKTHRKAGMTCAMKNFVGLNGNKDWLPHHTKYSVEEGGDEYLYRSFRKRLISKSWDVRWKLKNVLMQKLLLSFERQLSRSKKIIPFKDNFTEGSWYGNKTISRTVNDLNRAILYCGVDGKLNEKVQRKILYLVDGIICGEGEGPMAANSKKCNILLWGYNSYVIDLVVSQIIGFDFNKMDTFRVCSTLSKYKISDDLPSEIRIIMNKKESDFTLDNIRDIVKFNFNPSSGWKDHIELESK